MLLVDRRKRRGQRSQGLRLSTLRGGGSSLIVLVSLATRNESGVFYENFLSYDRHMIRTSIKMECVHNLIKILFLSLSLSSVTPHHHHHHLVSSSWRYPTYSHRVSQSDRPRQARQRQGKFSFSKAHTHEFKYCFINISGEWHFFLAKHLLIRGGRTRAINDWWEKESWFS